jgi:protein ImuA
MYIYFAARDCQLQRSEQQELIMTPDLQILAQRIAEIEGQSGPRLSSLASHPSETDWDQLLFGGTLAGTLVELLEAEEGTGAWALALFMARHACGDRKVLVVVDGERRFYPPAAAQWNIDLRRTIVVRPRETQSALMALTQSLRCAAVGAALAKLDQLSTTDCRRLQVAAETGGGVGFVVRSAAALNMPSFATVRLLLAPRLSPLTPHSSFAPRSLRVEVVCFRGAHQGRLTRHGAPLLLEIDDEKGDVHLSTALAGAESLASSARASG